MSGARKKADTGAKRAGELRKRAEEVIRKRMGDKDPEAFSVEEARRLVQELQVHQIELEMQNEELRHSQSMLEESRSKYSDLYDFAPVGYFTFDREGVILEANLTGAALLGVERAWLIRKPFTVCVAEDAQDAFYLHRRKVLEGGGRQTCELRLKSRDGKMFYARLESVHIEDSKLCRTSISDITDIKRVEEERERLFAELREALASVKVLKGLLPACAWCGRVKDDEGYWSRVEAYIEKHTETRFSHGICPECNKNVRKEEDTLFERDGDEQAEG